MVSSSPYLQAAVPDPQHPGEHELLYYGLSYNKQEYDDISVMN